MVHLHWGFDLGFPALSQTYFLSNTFLTTHPLSEGLSFPPVTDKEYMIHVPQGGPRLTRTHEPSPLWLALG